jgi:hypothetical protein
LAREDEELFAELDEHEKELQTNKQTTTTLSHTLAKREFKIWPSEASRILALRPKTAKVRQYILTAFFKYALQTQENDIDKLCNEYFRVTTTRDKVGIDAEGFIDAMKEYRDPKGAPFSPKAIRLYWSIVRAFFNKVKGMSIPEEVRSTVYAKLPPSKTLRPTPPPIPKEDLKKILMNMPLEEKTFYTLAKATGARPFKEMYYVNKSDILNKADILELDANGAPIGRVVVIRLPRVKETFHETRMVIGDREAVLMLSEYLRTSTSEKLWTLSEDELRGAWRRATRKAKLDEIHEVAENGEKMIRRRYKWNPYCLRSFFISNAHNDVTGEGMEKSFVDMLVGHRRGGQDESYSQESIEKKASQYDTQQNRLWVGLFTETPAIREEVKETVIRLDEEKQVERVTGSTIRLQQASTV